MDIRMLPEIMNETIGKLKPICNLPSGTTLGETEEDRGTGNDGKGLCAAM